MEVLEFKGKTYVKAATAARELGYTADYVGQLCRGDKIDAQLVGRSWYVDEESLRAHKSSRYRSTKEKSKQALRDTLSDTPARTIPEPAQQTPTRGSASNHPFFRAAQTHHVAYDTDPSDLIPSVPERPISLETEPQNTHDEAQNAVEDQKAAESGEVHRVAIATEAPREERVTAQHYAHTEQNQPSHQIGVFDTDTEEKTVTLHVAHPQKQRMRRTHIRPSRTGEHAPTTHTKSRGGQRTYVYILLSATLALAFAVSALFVEQRYTSDTTATTGSTYNLNTAAAKDAVNSLK